MSKQMWRVLGPMPPSTLERTLNELDREGYQVESIQEGQIILRLCDEAIENEREARDTQGAAKSFFTQLLEGVAGQMQQSGSVLGVALEGSRTGVFLHNTRNVLNSMPELATTTELSDAQAGVLAQLVSAVFPAESTNEAITSLNDLRKIRDEHDKNCPAPQHCPIHGTVNVGVRALEAHLAANPAN